MVNGGFNSGYLEGLSRLSGIKQMQQQEEAMRLANITQTRRLEDEAKYSGALEQIFNTQQAADLEQGQVASDAQLADMYKRAGQLMLAKDPRQGMEFIKQSQDLTTSAANKKMMELQKVLATNNLLGELSGQVTDQQSLDQAVQEFARHGVNVPTQYRQWNPMTQAWFQSKAMNAIGQAKQIEFGLKQAKAAADAEQARVADERAAKGLQLREQAELRAQAAARRKERGAKLKEARLSKPPTPGQVFEEAQILEGRDDSFGDLSPGDQSLAAHKVYLRAAENMRNNLDDETYTEEQAFDDARTSVLEEITPKTGILGNAKLGTGTLLSGARQTNNPLSKPTSPGIKLIRIRPQ